MPKGYDVLNDLREHVLDRLIKEGVDSQVSQGIAHRMQEHFRKHWGGQPIYFKKTEDLNPRDMEIFNKFTGRNKDALLREYDISEVWFYQIIKKAKAEYIAKKQKNLL